MRVAATGALERSRDVALDYTRRARELLRDEPRLEALTHIVIERGSSGGDSRHSTIVRSVGVLPEPIEELLATALVGELTVIDPEGRLVTHPLIPFYDGELIYLTSSVLFSRKLEHIKANPKVSLSISDGRGHRRDVPPGDDPG